MIEDHSKCLQVVRKATKDSSSAERAAIVAWLRNIPHDDFDDYTIDAIERGEHLAISPPLDSGRG